MNTLPEITAPVVTLGSFDGVHAGHRVIIRRLNDLAAEVKGSSVLITFFPHPRLVLYPDSAGKGLKMISSQEEKISLLKDLGLDHLIIMEFTPDFAKTTSENFVERYLVEKIHAHTIVVGFNHYFGHNREGDYASLYRAGERFSFQVEEIPEQEIQNETVSSTRIRKALKEGNIQRANAYLEHHYMIRTRLDKGKGWESLHGHPCLQIRMDNRLKLLPPGGSYAATYRQGGRKQKALVQLEEGRLSFFPLEPKAVPDRSDPTIYFHLRMSGPGEKDLSYLLDKVQELIY